MNANAISLLGIFEKKMRLEVPLFQRQYVWNREHQWQPLWEDIARKFGEYVQGRREAPVHFLGAMVLDQKMTPTAHVERRQVIDGQQRLTTIQVFLAAFRDFCREQGVEALANESESFTLNRGMMADPTVDKFKVWPTQADRKQFADVIALGSRAAVIEAYPHTKRKYARQFDPRPPLVEAYLFFYDCLREFFAGAPDDPPVAADTPLDDRLDECLQALKNALKVVVVDLDQDDDAQVIFETLNARGEPLLPADLLRNYVFLRAARNNEVPDDLYRKYWQPFDDPFWRAEVRQGRLLRPRSDLFMQHFLASRLLVDIPVRHLYVEYKFWIERARPFQNVEEEVATLARQAGHYRRILEPQKSDVLYPLVTFLDCFEVRTADPFLIFLLDQRLCTEEWEKVATAVESYLLRRAVCGLTTKNYNRVFLGLTRHLRETTPTSDSVIRFLSSQVGESVDWPRDDAFYAAWRAQHLYRSLNNPKVVHLLRRLNETYLNSKAEQISIESALSVEHIMPQDWRPHWPLSDGRPGVPPTELWQPAANDPRAEATRRRDALVQTIGNLTILTQPLNSSVRNASWKVKRQEIPRSLLPINHDFPLVPVWDEAAIEARADELFKRAIKIWPPPV